RLKLAPRTADDLEHLGGRALLLQCLGKVPPRLGELTGARLKLLLQLARVRLELLFRRSLGFLRRVKMTHVGRPRARICRSETIPRQPHCCVTPFTRPDPSPGISLARPPSPSQQRPSLPTPLTPGPVQNISGVAQGPAVHCVIPWVRFVGTKRGEARPHVRHETTRFHHAARRRGGVAARGTRAGAACRSTERAMKGSFL